MSLEDFTRARCPELADFLTDCCERELSFVGEHPIEHSSHNHIHLWAVEYWADHHTWIDTDYRVEFAQTVLDRWKSRLKGYRPYRDRGYRLYLYQDLAPTVSVVAETKYGFPYPDQPVFVQSVREIMALLCRRELARELFVVGDRGGTNARRHTRRCCQGIRLDQ